MFPKIKQINTKHTMFTQYSKYLHTASVSMYFSWFINFPTYQTNVITLFIHLSDLFNHCPILQALEPRGPGSYFPSTQASGLLVLSLTLPRRNRRAWWGCGCMLSNQQSECRRWEGEWSSVGGGQEEESQNNENSFLGQRSWRVQERSRSMLLSNWTNNWTRFDHKAWTLT